MNRAESKRGIIYAPMFTFQGKAIHVTTACDRSHTLLLHVSQRQQEKKSIRNPTLGGENEAHHPTLAMLLPQVTDMFYIAVHSSAENNKRRTAQQLQNG